MARDRCAVMHATVWQSNKEDGEYETQLYGLLSTKADKGKAYVNVFDFGPVSGVLTS